MCESGSVREPSLLATGSFIARFSVEVGLKKWKYNKYQSIHPFINYFLSSSNLLRLDYLLLPIGKIYHLSYAANITIKFKIKEILRKII